MKYISGFITGLVLISIFFLIETAHADFDSDAALSKRAKTVEVKRQNQTFQRLLMM